MKIRIEPQEIELEEFMSFAIALLLTIGSKVGIDVKSFLDKNYSNIKYRIVED